jgi:hypothetical protein
MAQPLPAARQRAGDVRTHRILSVALRRVRGALLSQEGTLLTRCIGGRSRIEADIHDISAMKCARRDRGQDHIP